MNAFEAGFLDAVTLSVVIFSVASIIFGVRSMLQSLSGRDAWRDSNEE
jgi:Na+/H+ antiporter NhaB